MSPVLAAELQPKLYLSLVCVLSAVPCWLLGWRDKGGPGRLLSLAALSFAIGLPPLLFKVYLPRVPTTILGNAAVLTAMGLHWHAAGRFAERSRPSWTIAVVPLAWIGCWLCPDFVEILDLRIATAAVMTGMLSLLAIAELRRIPGKALPLRMLSWISAMQVAFSAGRFWLALDGSSFGHSMTWITCTELNILGYVVLWPALGLVMIFHRLIEQERNRGERDELSGALNRRGFLAQATGRDQSALLLFDIDRFKRINDLYGHGCGDEAIVAFVMLTKSLLPVGTVFGRIGGEEFAALLDETQFGEAERVAEAVRAAFEALVLPCGLTATVSIGIARGRENQQSGISDRLGRADRALYQAKHGGRNRIHTWSASGKAMLPREERREVAAPVLEVV